jgi:hypothetical protein
VIEMPHRYRIWVKERLDSHWAAWFEGLAISYTAEGGTLLEGTLVDHTALYGLIGKARDLGLTLIAVQRIVDERSGSTRSDGSAYGDAESHI